MIQVENLSKSFGKIKAVDQINLSIASGEFVALIGPNGAGKSTLFRMMLGLVVPTSGKITVEGQDVTCGWSTALRTQLGYGPENIQFHECFTGYETLAFFAKIKKAPLSSVDPLLDQMGLSVAKNRKVGEYSKGMRQRLGLAQALIGNPKILFLDEPTGGLDPEGVQHFYQILSELKDITIVMTSHFLKEIEGRVDRLGVLVKGRLIKLESTEGLIQDSKLLRTLHVSYSGSIKPWEELFIRLNEKVTYLQQGQFQILCTPEHRVSLIRSILDSGIEVKDIKTIDPSIEDIFSVYTTSPMEEIK